MIITVDHELFARPVALQHLTNWLAANGLPRPEQVASEPPMEIDTDAMTATALWYEHGFDDLECTRCEHAQLEARPFTVAPTYPGLLVRPPHPPHLRHCETCTCEGRDEVPA